MTSGHRHGNPRRVRNLDVSPLFHRYQIQRFLLTFLRTQEIIMKEQMYLKMSDGLFNPPEVVPAAGGFWCLPSS
jgi:hypothetical protein